MNIIDLPDDIFTLLYKYLCYVDSQSLRFTHSRLFTMPQPPFAEIAITKLGRHVKEPEKLCDKILEKKAIVSGSFVLACLYNTAWYNDIDIYEGREETKDPYLASVWDDEYNRNCLGAYLYSLFDGKYHHSTYAPQTYIIRNFGKFQQIIVGMDVKKFIYRTFDLDLCKVAFDGKKLYIKNWDVLFSRKDKIKPNYSIMLFYDHSDNKCAERMHKYNQRGFSITLHPKYDEILQYQNKVKQSATYCKHKTLLSAVRDGKLNLDKFN